MKIIAAVLTTLALTAPIAARADDAAQIKALYAKLAKAMETKSIAGIHALDTPDFTAVQQGKPISARQVESQMQTQFAMVGKVHFMKINITSMKIHGKTADVTSTFQFEAETPPQPGAPKGSATPHIFGMSGVVSNTLVKTPAGWRFKTMNETSGSASMDHKPIKQPAGGAPR